MTDRELLELAAKAAGIELRWNEPKRGEDGAPVDPFDSEWCYIPSAKAPHNRRAQDAGRGEIWNPLTDDGDALRLVVKLRIDVLMDGACIQSPTVEVIVNTGEEVQPFAIEALDTGDPYAATRRAIVRAAAAMAKGE